ncbi:MAG: GntR family transcriptional regulator [Trueperaceae bacterium]|nr:GntR family transcriptional regulator [Trueperaceae bacterium]
MNLSKYKRFFDQPQKSAAELVADALRRAVIDGELVSEQLLKQAELARVFGVSRIPIKEALVKLESEGFVVMHANSVAKVAALSHAEVSELYDIRLALETLALKNALPQLSTADFEKLERILTEADKTADSVKLGELNQAFHLSLYAAAKRPKLSAMIKQVHLHVDRYLRVAYALLPYQRPSSEEHWAILEACKVQNEQGASSLLNKHLLSVKEQISDYLFHLKP